LAASNSSESELPAYLFAMSAVMEAESISGNANAVAAATMAKMATTLESAPSSKPG